MIMLRLSCGLMLGVLLFLGVKAVFITNLDESCLRCICHAASLCNHTIECANGYCGPFWISRTYWVEAGQIVFPSDDPKRNKAYDDCANTYVCAKNITTAYFAKFGRDCDKNGATECMDYLMIHYNGGYSCEKSLDREPDSRQFLARFKECQGF